jgi:hypothetical protein
MHHSFALSIGEGLVHPTTTASGITLGSGAINKLLFTQGDELAEFDGMRSFHTSNS